MNTNIKAIQARFIENPFFILSLPFDCSHLDIERAGQKWLSMLQVGLEEASTYPTPWGPQPRTIECVRMAMAELRDPQQRMLHEIWAKASVLPESSAVVVSNPWKDIFQRYGW